MDLVGKTALVTGGAQRVGAEIVRTLARAGALVYLHHHRSTREAERLARSLELERARVIPLQADLTHVNEIDALFDRIGAAGQGLDILVGNAARYVRASLEQTALSTWDNVMAINLKAPFWCARRAAPLMLSRGGGVIVHVADLAGERAWPNHAAYSCSQAALLSLTRTLALELAPRIRVNAVAPGAVLWPDDMPEPTRKRLQARIPLERVGEPRDVAAAVRFLIENDFLTGETIRVDGGRGIVP